MKKNKTDPLSSIKLHAQHHDQIHVISSHIQDSIVTPASCEHDVEGKTFKLLANRFCWEKFLDPEDPIKVRVHSGIHFNHVTQVKKKNFHSLHPEKLYNLMSMHASENEIILNFSEQAAICISVDQVSCKMADLHEPYPTQFLPTHTHVD
jgi:hypothetical protein